jgi:hypothetical protein
MELKCGGCDITYTMPDTLYKRRQQDGQAFYCPNGCARHFRETETDTLKKLNSALNDKVADLRAKCGAVSLYRFLTRLCPDCRSVKLTPRIDGKFLCRNCKLVNESSKMKWKVNVKKLNKYFTDNS